MDADHIEKLLLMLGCSQLRYVNGWIKATCPLAPWKHATGKDSHPSFGISIHPNDVSHYNCYTCRQRGSLNGLAWLFGRLSKRDMASVFQFLTAFNQPSVESLQALKEGIGSGLWGEKKSASIAGLTVSSRTAAEVDRSLLRVLPESDLALFVDPPDHIRAYLHKRGLTDQSITDWELKWHEGARRVVIPIRDGTKALVGISGRAFDKDQKPKYLHATGFRRDFYLYGEHRVRTGQVGYLCEGFFDVIYLHQCGYNAVAMMGSYLSDFQISKFCQLFKEAIIVPDGDLPGAEAAEKAWQALGRCYPRIAKVPDGKDPDELTQAELLEILGPPAG